MRLNPGIAKVVSKAYRKTVRIACRRLMSPLRKLAPNYHRLEELSPLPSKSDRKRPKVWRTLGHFYSPIVDPRSLPRNIYSKVPEQLKGISLYIENMESLWLKLLPHMAALPFPRTKSAAFRYLIDNGMYEYGDAAVYYAVLRETKPSRVIEIGSGFSSAVLLDTMELEQRLDDVTFIEPYPDTLNCLLRNEDRQRVRILSMRVQDVPLWEFERLQEGDILSLIHRTC